MIPMDKLGDFRKTLKRSVKGDYAVVRGLTAMFRKVTIILIPLAARSLAKRWLERQVGSVRTTENGSLSFRIVVAFRF